MRAVLFILILAVVALILALATGLLRIDQTQPAQVPEVSTTENGVTASGGQPPTFDIETGSVTVGATEANVTVPVPTVDITPAGQQPTEPSPATDNRDSGGSQ